MLDWQVQLNNRQPLLVSPQLNLISIESVLPLCKRPECDGKWQPVLLSSVQ